MTAKGRTIAGGVLFGTLSSIGLAAGIQWLFISEHPTFAQPMPDFVGVPFPITFSRSRNLRPTEFTVHVVLPVLDDFAICGHFAGLQLSADRSFARTAMGQQ